MEQRKRKPIRLKDYDYSSSGVYFITICTKDRKPILSRIVGDGVLDIPKVGAITNRPRYTLRVRYIKDAICL